MRHGRPLQTLLAFAFLGGCAAPKKHVELNTDRLLTEDPMQGWSVVEKAPPVVGEFDVIYMDNGASRQVDDECSYASGPNGTFVVCPEIRGSSKAKPMSFEDSDLRSI